MLRLKNTGKHGWHSGQFTQNGYQITDRWGLKFACLCSQVCPQQSTNVDVGLTQGETYRYSATNREQQWMIRRRNIFGSQRNHKSNVNISALRAPLAEEKTGAALHLYPYLYRFSKCCSPCCYCDMPGRRSQHCRPMRKVGSDTRSKLNLSGPSKESKI